MDLITLLVEIALIQLTITGIAVVIDILIVFRVVWLSFVRQVPKEDRPYLWAGVAGFAKDARERSEIARMRKERDEARTK